MKPGLDEIVQSVRSVYSKVEESPPDRFVASTSATDPELQLEGRIGNASWLHLREDAARLQRFDEQDLLGLLRANEPPARCRFAAVGAFVTVCADYPMHLYGAEGLPDLLRVMHSAALDVGQRISGKPR